MMIIWGLTLICAVMADSTHEIHQRMTADERLEIFQSHDENVQRYEVVPIHWPKLQKRSARIGTRIHLKAFGEDIGLWLTPADGVLAGYDTPVYMVKQGASGPDFEKNTDVMQEMERFEDLEKSAAFIVTQRSRNARRIIGTVGSHDLVIAPIPERLVEEVRRQRRSVDDTEESEQDDHHYHIVYKRSSPVGKTAYLEKPLRTISHESPPESSSIPDTVYPEILVVVTHDLFMKLGGNMRYAVAYILAFWNGVDLKYRSLENPKFRLNIAGIVVAQDSKGLGYIAEHFNGRSLIANRALLASSGYWLAQKHHIPVESYDVLMTMTSHHMCNSGKDRDCDSAAQGLAYRGGACDMLELHQVMSRVSIVGDSGGFDGIQVAAHELAHSLGANHDGVVNTDCPVTNGHIMNPSISLDRSPDWSECTLKDFHAFLKKGPVCLYNNPIQKNVLPSYLPGKFMDADQQCRRYVGTKACSIDYSICGRLGCVNVNDPKMCIQILGGAADGTTCGPDQICLHGRCRQESVL